MAAGEQRGKGREREGQGKARHLLYLVSELDVAPRRNQLLHRARVPFMRRGVDRRLSILGERVRGGAEEEASGCGGYILHIIYIYINASQAFSSDILLFDNSNANHN